MEVISYLKKSNIRTSFIIRASRVQWSFFFFLVVVAKKKKKKSMFFYYIYNFYFENLIYKWINKFENQQESDPIFLAMF